MKLAERPASFVCGGPSSHGQQAFVVVCGYGGDDCVHSRLVGYTSPRYTGTSLSIVPGQQEVVKTACKPQRHGILQRQAGPVGNSLAAHRVALHQRQLRFDHTRGDRRVVPAAMFGLHLDALCYPSIVHHAQSECVCHIALSAAGP